MSKLTRALKKTKRFLLDILSFGSPQAKVINLSGIFLLIRVLPIGTLEQGPLKCVFRHFLFPLFFGDLCPPGLCKCPACDMTHAMSRLLRGDPTGAWNYNKLVFPVFIIMLAVLLLNVHRWMGFYKKNKRLY